MMKHYWFVALCVFSLHASTTTEPFLFDLFVQQADKYVLEPRLAILFFTNMKIQEFEKSWNFLSETLIHRPERVVPYVEKYFSERESRDLLLGQCAVYNTFLTNLFVCEEDGTLLFSLERPMPAGYTSIFEYEQQHETLKIEHFYAFYFDRLAADFIEAVNNAFLNSDHDDFGQYKQDTDRLLSELYMVYERLYGSEYEARYGISLKSYQDIFQMLMVQKRIIDNA